MRVPKIVLKMKVSKKCARVHTHTHTFRFRCARAYTHTHTHLDLGARYNNTRYNST